MENVTLIDYGLGNISAFANIYRTLNIDVVIASTPAELASARKLILPGVGAFDWAMSRLNNSGLRQPLDELVLEKKIPVLGVCVGMQMMANSSEEGQLAGLGWIDGTVSRFSCDREDIPLPHMGWNDVAPVSQDCLFSGIKAPRFYYLHSYCFAPAQSEHILATADYGGEFVSAIRKNTIFGTQFHPEKSHHWGVNLLRNFVELR